MNLTPIPTKYNNILFRSRLEARWAVFFDSLNIQYFYEYEGYELKPNSFTKHICSDCFNEKSRVCSRSCSFFGFKDFDNEFLYYLPDFYIPKQERYGVNTFFEVKPNEECNDLKSRVKQDRFCSLLNEQFVKEFKGDSKHLTLDIVYESGIYTDFIILYNIPNIDNSNMDEIRCTNVHGRESNYFFCVCNNCGMIGVEKDQQIEQLRCKCKSKESSTIVNHIKNAYKDIEDAYRKAYSYRFY